MIGRRLRLFRVGHVFDCVGSLQRPAEEEAQSGRVESDGARTKLSFLEQVDLVGADLVGSELVRRTMEMLGKRSTIFR